MCKLISLGQQSTPASLLTKQGTPAYPIGQQSTDGGLDPRWERSISAIVMSSLNNSSESMTSCGRVGLSHTDHSCLAPHCDLVRVRPCRRQLGAATDRRCERQLEYAISRTEAAIPLRLRFRPTRVCWIQHASSLRSPGGLFRRSLAVHTGGQSINQV